MSEKDAKKVKQVAALKYSPEENKAPKIIALGKGEAAEKIIEKAEESDVPVYEDANLAAALNTFNVGEEIPPELYGIVAEILVFVSQIDRNFGERYGRKE